MTADQLKDALVTNNVDFLSVNRQLFEIDHRFADSDNDTLLLYALSDADSEVYSYLLENNPNIYAENDKGENALHSIVFSGDVQRLWQIEQKYPEAVPALINRQSADGTTPLLLSALLEQKEIFNYLLEKGADVNIADNEGSAPIHPACYFGQIDLVVALAERAAVLNRKTKSGNYPLTLAINADHSEIVKYLFPILYNLERSNK